MNYIADNKAETDMYLTSLCIFNLDADAAFMLAMTAFSSDLCCAERFAERLQS